MGNHRLKSAFDMRSELFPGGPQIFTGFYELVSREKKKGDQMMAMINILLKKQFFCNKVDIEQNVLHNCIAHQ